MSTLPQGFQPLINTYRGFSDGLNRVVQPLANIGDGLRDMAGKVYHMFSPPPDTSWHDQQVQKANDSFKQPVPLTQMTQKLK